MARSQKKAPPAAAAAPAVAPAQAAAAAPGGSGAMDAGKVQAALADLAANPKTKANLVVSLLTALEATFSEATQRSIIHGLKLFFADAGLEGQLLHQNEQPAENTAQAAADGTKDAQRVYREWLKRQYNRYVNHLFTLLTTPDRPVTVQVSAVNALFDLARSEAGPGLLSGPLTVRTISRLVTSPHTAPEVFSLLFTRFFQHADIRYYTLWACRSLAGSTAARGSRTVASLTRATTPATARTTSTNNDHAGPDAKKDKKRARHEGANGHAAAATGTAGPSETDKATVDVSTATGQQDEDLHAAMQGVGAGSGSDQAGTNSGSSLLSDADLFRNLFDVLTALPPGLTTTGGGAAADDAGAGDGGAGAGAALQSWCGITDVGDGVAAKADRNESARVRRKRKAEEAMAAGGGSGEAGPSGGQSGPVKAVWANRRSQKRLYSEAWLALLSLDIASELLSKVLLFVHETLIPNMMHPGLLADFLTHCLDKGGLTGMLALNGIFLLVTQHGLEYPAFYTRLYSLLTPSAMASRHRAQFFALADVFLSSPLVPAYTIAAFVKRLARLALRSAPAGALIAIAFIHNLIRRHPSLMVLLHDPATAKSHSHSVLALDPPGTSSLAKTSTSSKGGPIDSDPYDPDQPDPAQSRAVESSLWELEALRHHYSPHVSTLCNVLDRDLSDKLKTSEVDIQALLTTSYASLFDQEVTRRIKQVPIAFYAEAPTQLFGPHCAANYEGWELPQQEQQQHAAGSKQRYAGV